VRDGIIQAWGDNANGQLDDGTTTHQVNPIPVSGITEAMAIAAGDNHSLARLNDGRVMGWGKTAREASGMETLHNNRTIPVSAILHARHVVTPLALLPDTQDHHEEQCSTQDNTGPRGNVYVIAQIHSTEGRHAS